MPRTHHDAHHSLVRAILASPYPPANLYHLPLRELEHDGHRGRSNRRRYEATNEHGRHHRQPAVNLDIERLIRDGYPVILNLNYCPCSGSRHRHRAVTPSASSSFESGLSGDADDETQPVLRTPETSHQLRRRDRSPHPGVKVEATHSISDLAPTYRSSSPESSASSERTIKAPGYKLKPPLSVIAEASPIDATFNRVASARRRYPPQRKRPVEQERPIEGMCGFDIERWRHSAATFVAGPSTAMPPPYSSPAVAAPQPMSAPEPAQMNVLQPYVPPPLPTASTVYMDVCPTATQTVYMDVSTPQPPPSGTLRPPPSSGWPMPMDQVQDDVPMLSRRPTSQPARSMKEGTPMDWQAGNETDPGLNQPPAFSTTSQRPSLPADLRQKAQTMRRKRAARRRKALRMRDSTLHLRRADEEIGQRRMDEQLTPALALSAAMAQRASVETAPRMLRKRQRSSRRSSFQTRHSEVGTSLHAVQARGDEGTSAEGRSSVSKGKRKAEIQDEEAIPTPTSSRIAAKREHSTPTANPIPNPSRGKRKRSPLLLSSPPSKEPAPAIHRPIRNLPMSDLAAFNAALQYANRESGQDDDDRLAFFELEFEELFANGFDFDEGWEEEEEEGEIGPGEVVAALVREEMSSDAVGVGEREAKRIAL